MIPSNLSNRLVFIFSLLGLAVAAFLFYEYTYANSVYCLVGTGCNIIRNSPYANFLGISIPAWGIVFYLIMAILALLRSHSSENQFLFRMQILAATVGVGFGIYLTYLELFAIKAVCFWCVLSFIISILLLLSVILGKKNIYENGN
ncbi:vitamin K epoxide reductase family protein [Patescibacteria group bacterium]|nr:vitamin K epoxide reductase family protein [Patescibacteria group bacterium]